MNLAYINDLPGMQEKHTLGCVSRVLGCLLDLLCRLAEVTPQNPRVVDALAAVAST